ncbi:MAG: hypothetical protein Q8K24_10175 [Hydrogenophaga sp.]|nr:hypothetical protein [Hydrogenophaga sp.]
MTRPVKWLFTAISAVMALASAAVIVTEVRTASTRYEGIVTVVGDDAVWVGQTGLLLAALPLAVWLPPRWLGPVLTAWWIALMLWVFGTVFGR